MLFKKYILIKQKSIDLLTNFKVKPLWVNNLKYFQEGLNVIKRETKCKVLPKISVISNIRQEKGKRGKGYGKWLDQSPAYKHFSL